MNLCMVSSSTYSDVFTDLMPWQEYDIEGLFQETARTTEQGASITAQRTMMCFLYNTFE